MPEIQKQEVTPSDSKLRVLLYGDTGTGKTLLTATTSRHADMTPVLYINFDDGLASIAHLKGIYHIKPKNLAEVGWLKAELSKPDEKRDKNLRGIKTVVIDSLSAGRDQMIAEYVKRGMNQVKNPRTEETIQVQDYSHMQYALGDLVATIRQQPFHIITTAGVKYEYTGDVLTGTSALLNPGILQQVSHMMGYIWYTAKKGEKYQLLTVNKGIFNVKTRNPKFERVLKAASPNKDGWFALELDDDDIPTPGLDTLFDLFLKATQ